VAAKEQAALISPAGTVMSVMVKISGRRFLVDTGVTFSIKIHSSSLAVTDLNLSNILYSSGAPASAIVTSAVPGLLGQAATSSTAVPGPLGQAVSLSYFATLWIPIYNYSYRKFIYVSILKQRR
jgi:hypothetical protein